MTVNELSNYMKENLSNYPTFYKKALEYQHAKNKKRTKRWNEYRVEKEASLMWDNVIKNMHNQLSSAARSDNSTIIGFIEKNNLLESINDSMCEVEFEEE